MTTETADLQGMMQRLDAVETQNRFLKRVISGILLGAIVMLAFGLFVSRTGIVEAREFVVRDGEGNRRAVWTTTPKGISVLHLLDREGSARATLSVTPEGTPTLALTDHDEKSMAAMAITDEGPALGLYDADRKPLIAMP